MWYFHLGIQTSVGRKQTEKSSESPRKAYSLIYSSDIAKEENEKNVLEEVKSSSHHKDRIATPKKQYLFNNYPVFPNYYVIYSSGLVRELCFHIFEAALAM